MKPDQKHTDQGSDMEVKEDQVLEKNMRQQKKHSLELNPDFALWWLILFKTVLL